MSGVTIMILIILLIAILMSYVLYCDPDTSPDLASLGENMVTNLISPAVILTEGEKIKSPRPLQVESNIVIRFLLNIQEEQRPGICSICVTLNICSLLWVWIVWPGSPGLWSAPSVPSPAPPTLATPRAPASRATPASHRGHQPRPEHHQPGQTIVRK